jgi:predicted DNA-binding transcriptional regulator YafY
VALLVARKAIEQYANTPFQKPLALAFQKLSAGLEGQVNFNWQELEHTFDFRPIGMSKQNLAVFETVAAGLREERELELQYQKLEAKRPELRRVQPYSLVCVENQWYLRAWDLVRRDLRTFHLGRITQAKKLPHRFRRPTGFDANESLLGSIGVYVGTQPENVVLRFSGWAATVVVNGHGIHHNRFESGEMEVWKSNSRLRSIRSLNDGSGPGAMQWRLSHR